MGEMKNDYTVLVGKSEGKRLLGSLGINWTKIQKLSLEKHGDSI
jgi:hypothetical protein